MTAICVGHRHRLFLVVRDVDECDSDLVLDPLQLELHLLAELQVERAERLVEQENTRMVHERAAESDPLLLAARELLGLALREPRQPDELEHLGDAPFSSPFGRPCARARRRRCPRSDMCGKSA